MAGSVHRSASTRARVLGAAAALLLACVEKQQTPPASDKHPGTWVVAGHRAPGVSAMSDAEAATWHGRTVYFRTNEAISGADTCTHPVYRLIEARADSFLAAEYRISPTALGLESSPDLRLQVTQVFCGEREWAAMGGRVLWVSQDLGYGFWDGVFFELRPATPDGQRED